MEKTHAKSNKDIKSRTMDSSGPVDVQPIEDLMAYCRSYAQEKPEMAALWCFGIGFVLGWKLKPW